MDDTRRQQYAIVIAATLYAAIGVLFAWPATHIRIWRAGAWVLSAVIYGWHIGYERSRMHNAPSRAALHVASAVAVGALGLAISANVHSLSIAATDQHRRLLTIALVAWPILTGIPSFLVALAASEGLARFSSKHFRAGEAHPTSRP